MTGYPLLPAPGAEHGAERMLGVVEGGQTVNAGLDQSGLSSGINAFRVANGGPISGVA